MNDDDLKKVTKVRCTPAWDELSVVQVTGLIRLNLWLAQQLSDVTEDLCLVELGSLGGEGAAIFEAFPMWGHISCVDNWHSAPAYELCQRRLEHAIRTGKVTLHRALSTLAASDLLYSTVCAAGPPHFVYVDAAHDYTSVRDDLVAWYPRLAPGGFIGGHDYNTPWFGVTRAVDEFRSSHGLNIVTFPDSSYVLYPTKN